MKTAFTTADLHTGLDEITHDKKLRAQATKLFERELANGTDSKKALIKGFEKAAYGKANPKEKLRNAKTAVGLPTTPVKAVKQAIPTVKVRLDSIQQNKLERPVDSTSASSLVKVVALTIVGAFLGLILGLIFAPLIVSLYRLVFPTWDTTFLYWLVLIGTMVLGIGIGLWLSFRRLINTTTTRSPSTQHA